MKQDKSNSKIKKQGRAGASGNEKGKNRRDSGSGQATADALLPNPQSARGGVASKSFAAGELASTDAIKASSLFNILEVIAMVSGAAP